MTLSLFNQFEPPTMLGIPLTTAAILFPWFLLLKPCNRWLTNRTLTLQSWLIKKYTKEIFFPLETCGWKWTTLLASLMASLLGMNLLGLMPYTFTPTTHLSLSLSLSIPLWLATVLIGLRNQFSTSTSHLLPQGTPTPLIPILIIIETTSLLIRPIALGVRLTANLTAGHLLIQLISTTATTINPFILSAPIFTVLLTLTILEVAVAVIQAYVFTLLLSLYLQENT